jgi:hypothetical protein
VCVRARACMLATGNDLSGLELGVLILVRANLFSERHPDRSVAHPDVYSMGQELFSRGESGSTIHIQLLQSSVMCGSIYLLPIRHH